MRICRAVYEGLSEDLSKQKVNKSKVDNSLPSSARSDYERTNALLFPILMCCVFQLYFAQ